jgi:hypothetical protein
VTEDTVRMTETRRNAAVTVQAFQRHAAGHAGSGVLALGLIRVTGSKALGDDLPAECGLDVSRNALAKPVSPQTPCRSARATHHVSPA